MSNRPPVQYFQLLKKRCKRFVCINGRCLDIYELIGTSDTPVLAPHKDIKTFGHLKNWTVGKLDNYWTNSQFRMIWTIPSTIYTVIVVGVSLVHEFVHVWTLSISRACCNDYKEAYILRNLLYR